MDEYIGIIKAFGGNYAPQSFAMCNGAVMQVNQNQALYAILGVQYGGNGTTNFNLPDLRGRVMVGQGQGLNLPQVNIGEMGGAASTSLNLSNMPAHNHPATTTATGSSLTVMASNGQASSPAPTATANVLAAPYYENNSEPVNGYNAGPPNTPLNVGNMSIGSLNTAVGVQGSSTPFSIMQPYVGINYIICTQGLYPSRN